MTESTCWSSGHAFSQSGERHSTLRIPPSQSRKRGRRGRRRKECYQGFTLLELLIVTVIVGTLASITAPALQRARERALNVRAIADIRIMESEITIYIAYNFAPPVSLAVIGRAGMLDPWGNPYVYLALDAEKKGARKDKFLVPLNSDYDLYSMGGDGKSNTPLTAAASRDDILRALDGAFVGVAEDF